MKRDWMVEQYVKEQIEKQKSTQIKDEKAKQVHSKLEQNQKQSNKQYDKGLDFAFAQVRKFQQKMNQPVGDKPQQLDAKRAMFRTVITCEELVEFLYSSAEGNLDEFDKMVDQLKDSIDAASKKQKDKKEKVENVLVGQVDAAIDQIYLSLGTLVEMGVYPQEIMNIVQEANIAKLFPDGKPHFNEGGKVIKPDGWVAPESKIKKAIEGQIQRAEQRNSNDPIQLRGGKDNHLVASFNK